MAEQLDRGSITDVLAVFVAVRDEQLARLVARQLTVTVEIGRLEMVRSPSLAEQVADSVIAGIHERELRLGLVPGATKDPCP